MFETVLLAFLFAKWKGYRLSPALKSAWIYPIFLFDMFTIWLQAQVFLDNPDYIKYGFIVKNFYMVLYVIPIVRYKLFWPGIIGSGFIISGTLLNKLVMKVNAVEVMTTNGLQKVPKMPVYPTFSLITTYFEKGIHPNSPDAVHILGTAETKLKILTDYIDLGYSIISIGDVLIRVFVAIIIFYTIKAVQPPLGELKLRSEASV